MRYIYLNTGLVTTLLVLFSSMAFSQINLVKDINPGTIPNASSESGSLTVLNSTTMLFSARTPEEGVELWKTDGTEVGTVLVKDINPAGSSHPSSFVKAGNVVFFLADDGVHGIELWKSDGTVAGTVMVKDMVANGSLKVASMVDVNGVLLFANSSNFGLWKSDGTEAGTTLIRNDLGYIPNLCSVNGVVYFSAVNGGTGTELWKSDGTTVGTTLVKDINTATSPHGSSNPNLLTNINGVLYFTAFTPETGVELWKSDGSTAGTVMIKDIRPGETSTQIGGRGFVSMGSNVYFTADDGVHGYELWKTDGTDAGTAMMIDLYEGTSSSYARAFFDVNGTLFFSATRGYEELYKTDGTAAGTVKVQSNAGERINNTPVLLNGTLYYEAYTNDVGYALWKSDGTSAGTSRILDLNSYRNDYIYSTMSWMTAFNGEVFFSGFNDLRGWELWKSNGTTDGTQVVKEINMEGSSGISYMTKMGDYVYFSALDGWVGQELWKSDGTAEGTSLVKDIDSNKNGNPAYMVAAGNTLYFHANDGVHGVELWKSDGTTSGTVMVKDAVPGSEGLFANGQFPAFRAVGDVLYFRSATGTQGSKLWRSDGTESGTYALTTKAVTQIFHINSTIYFTMDDGITGDELWKTDGTVAGTVMVKDINPTGGSSVSSFVDVNGMLYFTATDGVNGIELWKSDGTSDGTRMVKNMNPTGSSSIETRFETNGSNVHNNILYFIANDGTTGRELWKTDGTELGTVMVKEIIPGLNGSSPSALVMVNGFLYFTAGNTSSVARQLWRSDGTAEGTIKVKDNFNASVGFTHELSLQPYVIGDMLYVLSTEASKGMVELWTVNGLNVCKVAEASDFYYFAPFPVINKKVFMRANSYKHGGMELFMYDGSNDVPCRNPQTITFADLPTDIRANDKPFAITATSSSGLPVSLSSSNTDVATVSGSTITPIAPGETEITASQAGDDVWAVAPSVTQTLVVDVILGLEDEKADDVVAFPNPFQHNVSFKIKNPENTMTSVKVYSITGHLIEHKSTQGLREYVMGESWAKGVYLVQIETRSKQIIRKVVKQ